MEVAEELYLKALTLNKDYIFALSNLAVMYIETARSEEAVEYINRFLSVDPDGLQALWITGLKAYIEGNFDLGLEAARKLGEVNISDAEAWYHFAGNYALLGDRDGCIRALRRAVEGSFFNYPFMLTDFFLDSLRNDEEFQIILQQAREKHLEFREVVF